MTHVLKDHVIGKPERGTYEVVEEELISDSVYIKVTEYLTGDSSRMFNGGDYTGGRLYAFLEDGGVYARDWDTSDWDGDREWMYCTNVPAEVRAAFDNYMKEQN